MSKTNRFGVCVHCHDPHCGRGLHTMCDTARYGPKMPRRVSHRDRVASLNEESIRELAEEMERNGPEVSPFQREAHERMDAARVLIEEYKAEHGGQEPATDAGYARWQSAREARRRAERDRREEAAEARERAARGLARQAEQAERQRRFLEGQ